MAMKNNVKNNVEADPFLLVNSVDFVVPNELVISIEERVPVAILRRLTFPEVFRPVLKMPLEFWMLIIIS